MLIEEGERKGEIKGERKGKKKEQHNSIINIISIMKEFHADDQTIVRKLKNLYNISDNEIPEYFKEANDLSNL